MGLFGKKKKDKKEAGKANEIPALPELPSLPELPNLEDQAMQENPQQLPSFPQNQLGESLSQSTIKQAVSGSKRGDEVLGADELATIEDEELQVMPKPLPTRLTRELPGKKVNVPKPFLEADRRVREAAPVFIRIDKFQESLKTFEKAKARVKEIEKLLAHIKKVKEEEERELMEWENEVQAIKSGIEKINGDIFSKVE